MAEESPGYSALGSVGDILRGYLKDVSPQYSQPLDTYSTLRDKVNDWDSHPIGNMVRAYGTFRLNPDETRASGNLLNSYLGFTPNKAELDTLANKVNQSAGLDKPLGDAQPLDEYMRAWNVATGKDTWLSRVGHTARTLVKNVATSPATLAEALGQAGRLLPQGAMQTAATTIGTGGAPLAANLAFNAATEVPDIWRNGYSDHIKNMETYNADIANPGQYTAAAFQNYLRPIGTFATTGKMLADPNTWKGMGSYAVDGLHGLANNDHLAGLAHGVRATTNGAKRVWDESFAPQDPGSRARTAGQLRQLGPLPTKNLTNPTISNTGTTFGTPMNKHAHTLMIQALTKKAESPRPNIYEQIGFPPAITNLQSLISEGMRTAAQEGKEQHNSPWTNLKGAGGVGMLPIKDVVNHLTPAFQKKTNSVPVAPELNPRPIITQTQ